MSQSLHELFESSHFQIFLGPHSVILAVSGILEGSADMLFKNPVCVITACNPSLGHDSLQVKSQEENEVLQKKLEEYLIDRGYEFYPASGKAADGSHEEPSFAIFRIEPKEALAIAKEFSQKAIFFYENDSGKILYTNE